MFLLPFLKQIPVKFCPIHSYWLFYKASCYLSLLGHQSNGHENPYSVCLANPELETAFGLSLKLGPSETHELLTVTHLIVIPN